MSVLVATRPISGPPRACRYCERYGRHCGRTHSPQSAVDWSRDWRGTPRPEPGPGSYLIAVDHVVYSRRNGDPFTLVEAVAEVRGTGNARILRTDGTVVLRHAGSTAADWLHAPTGTVLRHRRTRWAA